MKTARRWEMEQTDMFPTINEARTWLKDAARSPEGAVCPCCERFDKVYTRKISRASIRKLIALWRLHKKEPDRIWWHYSEFAPTVGDFAKLEHVDLVCREWNDDDSKSGSGNYRITGLGLAFIQGKHMIPESIILYHGELIGFGPENRMCRQFVSDFDYRELMAA